MANTPSNDDGESLAHQALVDRLQRNDVADQELRRASARISSILPHLPASDDLLFLEDTLHALRTLRDKAPHVYLGYRACIRQKCGRHLVDLLDFHVGPPRSRPAREIVLQTATELIGQAPVEWRTDGIFPKRGLATIIGAPGSGKTFLALDMALAIARGTLVLGRNTRPCPVLYISAEGRLRERVEALHRHLALNPAEVDIRFIEAAVDLRGNTADLEHIEQLLTSFRPGVIFIDTLARVSAGGNENSSEDMGALLASFRRLEDAYAGLVIVIHHIGKDERRGARGHSSLRAALDVELEVSRLDTGIRYAKVSKSRDAEDSYEFAFRLEQVPLDDNQSSCVAIPIDNAPKRTATHTRLTPRQQLALDELRQLIADSGKPLPRTSTVPGKKGGRLLDWRERFYARVGKDIEKDSRRKAFVRVKEELQQKKLVGVWAEWAWLWGPD